MPKKSLAKKKSPKKTRTRSKKPPTLQDLKEDPENPRTIDEGALAGLSTSLEEFGDLSGLTWNSKTGTLVSGHQRLKALREKHGDDLKVKDGSVVTPDGEVFKIRVVDWPPEKHRLASLAANSDKIAGTFTALAVEQLGEMKIAFPDLSVDLRMDDLRIDLEGEFRSEPSDGKTDPDEVPELSKKAVTERGDLLILGKHRILCGDATNRDDFKKLTESEEPGAVVTDPPYGIEFQSNYRKKKHVKIDGDRDASLLLFACKLRAHHSKYIWCRWDNVRSCPKPKSLITWIKNNWSMGDLEHEHARQTEVCLFYPGELHHFPGKRPTDCVLHARTNNTLHPTQKPVALMVEVISWTQGIIFDPFLGSGTTLIAAEQLGRRCFGIEIEPRYVDVIVERWQNFTGKKAKRKKA